MLEKEDDNKRFDTFINKPIDIDSFDYYNDFISIVKGESLL
ncbi:hypothetical protein LCGC14_0989210 [marine sediment metagenome]|uniref:Uncharacterized protein n=1 Tax=marine sediment metagenome TaxID=412755 RepID=A0A0F9RCV8_9ZZZZ